MLTQHEIPQRRAIAFANQEMITILDDVRGLNQQYASLGQDVEALKHSEIVPWTQQFSDSALRRAHVNLRLRNSPDRWFSEITTAASELQGVTREMAEDSLKHAAVYSFDRSNPALLAPVTSEISKHLTFIEVGMQQLIESLEEMDHLAHEVVTTYSRRVHSAIASQSSEKILLAADEAFAALHGMGKGRGGGDPVVAEGYAMLTRNYYVTPKAISQRNFESEKSTPQVETFTDEQPDTSFSELVLEVLRREAENIGPRDVERHFIQVFKGKKSMPARELMGSSVEDILFLIRLIDCCGLINGFDFEIAWPDQDDEFVAIPTIANLFRRINDVTIRRRQQKEE